jgi:hypothetical protein
VLPEKVWGGRRAGLCTTLLGKHATGSAPTWHRLIHARHTLGACWQMHSYCIAATLHVVIIDHRYQASPEITDARIQRAAPLPPRPWSPLFLCTVHPSER